MVDIISSLQSLRSAHVGSFRKMVINMIILVVECIEWIKEKKVRPAFDSEGKANKAAGQWNRDGPR